MMQAIKSFFLKLMLALGAAAVLCQSVAACPRPPGYGFKVQATVMVYNSYTGLIFADLYYGGESLYARCTPPPGADSCDAPGAAGSNYNGDATTSPFGVAFWEGYRTPAYYTIRDDGAGDCRGQTIVFPDTGQSLRLFQPSSDPVPATCVVSEPIAMLGISPRSAQVGSDTWVTLTASGIDTTYGSPWVYVCQSDGTNMQFSDQCPYDGSSMSLDLAPGNPSGRYIVMVRKCNSDGSAGDIVAGGNITITPCNGCP